MKIYSVVINEDEQDRVSADTLKHPPNWPTEKFLEYHATELLQTAREVFIRSQLTMEKTDDREYSIYKDGKLLAYTGFLLEDGEEVQANSDDFYNNF